MAPEFRAKTSSNVLNLDLLIGHEIIINNECCESFNYYLKKLNFLELVNVTNFECFSKNFPTVAFSSLLSYFPEHVGIESLKN